MIVSGVNVRVKRGELPRGKIKLEVKKRIVKTLIWSTVLYAAETWTLRKVDIQRLESFEMWIWRRLMKISWTEHRSNQEVLDMVDENRRWMKTEACWTPSDKDRKNWLGHVLRYSAYNLRKQNWRDKNSWKTECYDDRLDEKQRRGIWT